MMKRAVLLTDFGSTYTKLTAVSLDPPELLGSAKAHTTLDDIARGQSEALALLERETGALDITERYACSSAAGGLRMAVSGLVGSLTGQAAKLACLGAGAKVVATYSHHLTGEDLDELLRLKPDIVLLAGGTDGGNTECILYNARAVAGLGIDCPVVVAGNRNAGAECRALLEAGGKEVHLTANIMPDFDRLSLEEAQAAIREVFLERIVEAKGLSSIQPLIQGILMPTPSAVLAALQLFSAQAGDLMAVDVGGATTDVYSIADGTPQTGNRVVRGLPEPRVKRTVEGDMGMRHSARSALDASGTERFCALSGAGAEAVEERLALFEREPDALPLTEQDHAFDTALASLCVENAFSRHSGRLEQVFTPMGMAFSQTGKDLTGVKTIVATGGPLIHARRLGDILRHGLYSADRAEVLNPVKAKVYLDKRYILSAMGVLAQRHPEAALEIMRKELDVYGTLE